MTSNVTTGAEPKGSCLAKFTHSQPFNVQEYPGNLSTVQLPIVDLSESQNLLQKANNFSRQTELDYLEVYENGCGRWEQTSDESSFRRLLDRGSNKSMLRVMFLGLVSTSDQKEPSSFGCRITATQQDVCSMLDTWQISPLFINMMLGQYTGNHLPATEVCSFGANGVISKLGFVFQQPRWGFKNRRFPISMFSNYCTYTQRTDCVVTFEVGDERIEAIQQRLRDAFGKSTAVSSATRHVSDPFFMHNLIAHQSFMASDSTIFELGQSLYKTLDQLTEYSKEGFDRDGLKSTTFQLHEISQDMDSLLTSADTNIALISTISDAQRLLTRYRSRQDGYMLQSSQTTTVWLSRAFEARKRWLLGARARKETAISLVYHLVSQKDTELSTAIARDTKVDSASMKSIAAFTMVFLPLSTVSSFFGMVFFDNTEKNIGITISPDWWLFLVVTIPLTILIMCIWKCGPAVSTPDLWRVLSRCLHVQLGPSTSRRQRRADEEFGEKSSTGT